MLLHVLSLRVYPYVCMFTSWVPFWCNKRLLGLSVFLLVYVRGRVNS